MCVCVCQTSGNAVLELNFKGVCRVSLESKYKASIFSPSPPSDRETERGRETEQVIEMIQNASFFFPPEVLQPSPHELVKSRTLEQEAKVVMFSCQKRVSVITVILISV